MHLYAMLMLCKLNLIQVLRWQRCIEAAEVMTCRQNRESASVGAVIAV